MSKSLTLPASLKQLLVKGNELFIPGISIDSVIFGFHENTLKLLLLDNSKSNKWTLPGGFVLKSEDINVNKIKSAIESQKTSFNIDPIEDEL